MSQKIAGIVLGSLLFSTVSFAAKLDCHIDINNSSLIQETITTKSKQKVSIGEADSVQAFITEKVDGIYTMEAFIGDAEIRLYSEGILKEKTDRLVTSLWSRSMLLDIECSLAK